MAFIQCDFISETLQLGTSMNVLLPRMTRAQRDKLGPDHKFPVLYLLHGRSDDQTAWMRYTSIERYTQDLNLAVIMPTVHRSFYTDMVAGYRYWTFISQEVPAVAASYFPLSTRREETFCAGLSMGGYGAFKLALRQPERFSYAASLSGALDMVARRRLWQGMEEAEGRNLFGPREQMAGSENDLMHLAQQLAATDGLKPKFYQCCGTEDFLYENNLRFRDHAQALGLDLLYEEGPGEHEWGYWDQQIQRVLAWLPVRGIDD